jgi:hypothetical protein
MIYQGNLTTVGLSKNFPKRQVLEPLIAWQQKHRSFTP